MSTSFDQPLDFNVSSVHSMYCALCALLDSSRAARLLRAARMLGHAALVSYYFRQTNVVQEGREGSGCLCDYHKLAVHRGTEILHDDSVCDLQICSMELLL